MFSFIPGSKLTVGQVLARLRQASEHKDSDLYAALNTTASTYLKIERDQRDPEFSYGLEALSVLSTGFARVYFNAE